MCARLTLGSSPRLAAPLAGRSFETQQRPASGAAKRGTHFSSSSYRPIIGVTGPDRGGGAAWWFTRAAVLIAGGWAVRITPSCPRKIESLQGLIIGGGA